MQPHKDIHISTRDRVMRAWQNSMEAVRDYQRYAKEISDPHISDLFSRCAETEGYQAAALHEVLQGLGDGGLPRR